MRHRHPARDRIRRALIAYDAQLAAWRATHTAEWNAAVAALSVGSRALPALTPRPRRPVLV